MNDRGKASVFRFSDDVLEGVDTLMKRWGVRTQKEAVSRAILEAAGGTPRVNAKPASVSSPDVGLLQKVYERQLETQIICEEIVEAVRAKKEARAAQPVPHPRKADGAGNPDFLPCNHCGLDGMIHPKRLPTAACSECQAAGHTDYANCDKCARIAHAASLAAKSTSCEPEAIDYDPAWGQ